MKFFLFFCLLSASTCSAQNFIISDQHHYGTSGFDNLGQTIKCQDGGFLMISSSAANDHDKTQPSYGDDDIWVVRLNADKTIRWEKTFGGSLGDYPRCIVELTNGSILVAGESFSPISGNKTTINYGSNDYWLLKLNSSGDKIWEKSIGSSSSDSPSTVLEISPNNYVMIGSSMGGTTGAKTVPSYGGFDIWAVAIDSTGAQLWQKAYGGDNYDGTLERRSLKLQNNHALILSYSQSGISGNKNSVNYGMDDVWVMEIDPSNGQIIHQNSIGGTENDDMYEAIEKGGFIYLAGTSRSGVSGNKQSVLYGTFNAWILKLDQNLSVISDQSYGGTQGCSFTGGLTSTTTGFIACGSARNDNNPFVTGTVNGTHDAWLVGFDNAGVYQWNYKFGTANNGFDIVQDVFENNPYNYTFSFLTNSPGNSGDLIPVSYGSYDFFLIDLETDLFVDENALVGVSIYPNPVTSSFSIDGLNESAYYEIADLQGHIVESGNYSGIIDAEKFNAGMYTIRIVSGSQTLIRKWVKN